MKRSKIDNEICMPAYCNVPRLVDTIHGYNEIAVSKVNLTVHNVCAWLITKTRITHCSGQKIIIIKINCGAAIS